MKKLIITITLFVATLCARNGRCDDAAADNPAGVNGIYNGNIATGCSYDSYTGNAHRSIDDIVVPGCVGAYPLKWTRYWNSRMSYDQTSTGGRWRFSYLDYGWDPSRAIAYFPDGRGLAFTFSETIPGVEEWVSNNAINLADGGKVTLSGSVASQIMDPYGQITTIVTSGSGSAKTTKVTEPGGRYLLVSYNLAGNVSGVQAFDGIAGHSAIQSVTYTYTPYTLHVPTTHTVPVLTRVDYSDGTSANYTYTTVTYAPVKPAPPSPTPQWEAAALATCDDVRYPGPMRQIAYQYFNSAQNGLRSIIASEKNLVTGEAVSSITGITGGTTTNTTETRGDNATRTFHYHKQTHELDQDMFFPLDGKLLDYTDFEGQTTTLTYETDTSKPSQGFITAVTDANNHTTSYTRSPLSWGILKITHPDGSHLDQTYTDEANPYFLASRADELGHTTTYTRNDPANPNAITRKDYPDGGWETFAYNSFGQVVTHVRGQSSTVTETQTFVYDSRGLKTSWTDAAGNQTTYTYYTSADLGGVWTDRVKTIAHPANASALQATETFEYDHAFVNGVSSVTPTAGRGLVTKVTYVDNNFVSNVYDIYGELKSATDELNHTTTHQYDDYKRVISTTDPLNHITIMSYLEPGQPNSYVTTSSLPFVTTLPSLKKVNTYFDHNWRKLQLQQAPGTPDEANSYFTYDPVGNLLTAKDPRNNVTTNVYDNRNRLTSVTDALNHATTFAYDAINKISETHANGELIEYDGYDAMNRLTHKKVHRDATTIDQTSMQYDLAGNLWKSWDERGYLYQYSYDPMNRRLSMIYPDTSKHEDTAYDGAGNVKTYTNRSGTIQTFTYDNRNRPTQFVWSDSTSSQSTTYDAASRHTQVMNNDATINFTYNDDNKLHTQEEWATALADNVHRIVTYTYDADGNRASIQYPSGAVFNYTYTNRNQIASIADASQHPIVNYTFDPSGNITARTLENGTSTSYTVDAVNKDTTVQHNLSSGAKQFDYAYNAVNDMTAVKRDNGTTGDGFAYDLTQQITRFQQNATVNPDWSVTGGTSTNLEFDGCGNRTKLNNAPLAPVNNMNQPTDAGIAYENNGNLQTYNGWTYTYDAQNRLRTALNSSSATLMQFYYDGLNRQVARSVAKPPTPSIGGVGLPPLNPPTVPAAANTFSVWDGDWALLEEYGSNNVLSESYLQGVHGLVKTLVSQMYFYQDELGSTSHIAGRSGTLMESYRYDLYGKPAYFNAGGGPISASAYAVRDLFAGQRFVPELGLYDDRNRFMSPDLGRFLQPDPIGFKGDGSNLYRYCGNDWANRADPTGLEAEITLIRFAVTPNEDQRGASGWYIIKENGNVIYTGRANENGFLPDPRTGRLTRGIPAGNYTLHPKQTDGENFKKGQPAITGHGLAVGQPTEEYKKDSVLVHSKRLDGGQDSRACVTVEPKANDLTRQVMDRNEQDGGTTFKVRHAQKAQPVSGLTRSFNFGFIGSTVGGSGGSGFPASASSEGNGLGPQTSSSGYSAGGSNIDLSNDNGGGMGAMMHRIPPSGW